MTSSYVKESVKQVWEAFCTLSDAQEVAGEGRASDLINHAKKHLMVVLETVRASDEDDYRAIIASSMQECSVEADTISSHRATPVPRVLIEVLHGAVSDVASDQPVDVRVLDYDTEEKQPEEWDVPVKPAYVGGHF